MSGDAEEAAGRAAAPREGVHRAFLPGALAGHGGGFPTGRAPRPPAPGAVHLEGLPLSPRKLTRALPPFETTPVK